MKSEKEIINNLAEAVLNDAELSLDEIVWLQNHKEAVLKYGSIELAQWAGITYDEWMHNEIGYVA